MKWRACRLPLGLGIEVGLPRVHTRAVLGGGLGLDIVGSIVSIVAAIHIALTSAIRGARVLGRESLHAIEIVGVNNRADVEPGDSIPTIPSHLAEHARDNIRAFGDRVPVPDPASRECDGVVGQSSNGDGINRGEAFLLSEVNGAGG